MFFALRLAAWLGSAAAAILLLTQSVSTEAQLSLSLTAIGTMLVIWRFGQSHLFRQAFLSVGTFVVIRYLYWRLTNTLPPVHDVLGFSIGLIVLLAEPELRSNPSLLLPAEAPLIWMSGVPE